MSLRNLIRASLVIVASFTFVTFAQAQPRRPKATPAPVVTATGTTAPSSAAAPTAALPVATDDLSASSPAVELALLPHEAEVRPAFKFGGFIDGQLTLVNKDFIATRGFTLNDAALYLEKDFGRGLSAVVDLPFSTPDGATNNSFGFAANKAQAYAHYTNGALMGRFGQFDTIFGVEKNDSRDRFFSDVGVVKGFVEPLTHTGLMVGFVTPLVSVRGIIANPRDSGTMANQNPEAGIQGRFDMTNFFASAGFMYGDQKNGTSNTLLDFMAGFASTQFNGNVYFADKKTSGVDKHTTGFGALGTMNLNPEFGLGVRIENVSDPITAVAGGTKSILDIAVGPSFRLTPDFTVRGDVGINVVDQNIAEDYTVFGGRLSVLAQF